ncbi:MAG: thermonuclease family protein, partial [Candidatus Zixiibacteriota bacterium]
KHPSKPVEPLGEEAAAFNDSLVNGKIVRLETDIQVRDRYRRVLAYVWVDSIFVNAELVKQGYAQVSTYPPNVRYEKLFLKLQAEAREAGRGLWAEDSSTGAVEEEVSFVGSKKSDKFHNPGCTWAKKIKPQNLVFFSSVEEAVEAGYIPCKVCKPAPLIAAPKKEVTEESSPTVYITRTGSKYHKITCGYLRKSCIPISLNDAKARGHGPCSRCRPQR